MNTPAPEQQEPGGYEFRIKGHLDYGWAEWFAGLALTRDSNGTTTLRGPVTDQAALHGFLTKVRDLGVTLMSVQAIDCGTHVTSTHNQLRRLLVVATGTRRPNVTRDNTR